MKLIAFVLSLILFTMVALPCTDSMFTCTNENNTVELHQTHQEHSHETHDECTPLCTCNCCGTSITIPLLITFKERTIKIYDTNRFFYTYNYHYKFAKGLWHPPNIS